MAAGKRASAGEVIPRDFREQLQQAEAQAAAEYDPGSIGTEDISDDLALTQTLAQIGDDESNAKVYVYKIDPKTKTDVFAFETTPAEFATGGLTEIGKRYGGGDYRVRVYANGRVVTHKRIAIMEQKDAPATPVNIAADLQTLFAQQQAAMLDGFRMLAESLKPAPQPPAPSMMEQLQVFAQLQGLMGGNHKQSGPDFGQMLDVLKQGMEMGRSGGEQSMLDVLMRGIETFGPVITEAVKAGAQNPALIQQAQAMPQNQAAIAAPVPEIQTQQPQNEDEMGILQNQILKQSIGFLVKQAQAGNDPDTYANMVLDQMDEKTLSDFVNRPDWLDFLAQYNAGVKEPANAAWFGELRVILIAYLTENDETGTSANHATITGTNNATAVNADGDSIGQSGND
jgi:hypothetical protein